MRDLREDTIDCNNKPNGMCLSSIREPLQPTANIPQRTDIGELMSVDLFRLGVIAQLVRA